MGSGVSNAKQTQVGCRDSVEFREFDFWVGDWTVVANGKPAGASSVQLILDDCVILENWTGARGYNGKSFNIYNPALKKWQQFWVDNTGGSILFTGEFKDGKLNYQSETVQPDGSVVSGKMSFQKIPDRKVRQVWEQSTDHGKTWKVVFDGVYTRKN